MRRAAPPRPLLALALALPLLLLGCQSCGTSAPAVRWKSGMRKFFANTAIQPDEPPRRLWTQKDQDLLLRRIGYADSAFVGKVRIISEYSAYDQTTQVSLAIRPTKILHGSVEKDLNKDGAVMLKVDPASEGFNEALANDKKLEGSRYLVFLKRRPVANGGIELRWALYRPTKALLKEVRAMYAWLEQSKKPPPAPTDVAMKKDAGRN